jgi:putative pyoverdin transport system ATP-binding/permease protein
MRDLIQLIGFLLRLSRGIRFSRLTIAVVTMAGIVGGIASTAMIALITSVVTGAHVRLAHLGWAFVGLCVLLPIFRFFSQILLIDLTQKSLLEFRMRLTRSLLGASLRNLETIGRPRLLATLTNDITVIVESLTAVPGLFMHSAVVASCLAYLGWLSWKVLLEITVFIVVGVVTYQLPVIKAMGYFRRARERFDEMTGFIRALVEGTKELKMHRGRQLGYMRAFYESVRQVQRNSRTGSIIYSAAASWGQILFFVVIGLMVFVLPRFQPLPRETLIAFTIVLFQMMTPLEVLMNVFPNLSRALVSARTVEQLGLSLEAENIGREEVIPAGYEPRPDWTALELDGVTHSYRRENVEESFQLGPIDLAFKPGELVFIVGGNGSGKTTLAKLLLGLYAPESGEIRFSGEAVTDESRGRYREHFSAVFSDFFVFETLFGLAASSLDEEARKYIERLHLQQKVEVREGALSTVELSQGQRKRLALLTAYLEDRPIYLFDEWAADQDPLFKEIFYLELLPELKSRGKTVFVISHDDHYYYVADRILKLDYGKIESDRTIAEFLGTSLVEAELGRGGRGLRR